MKKIIVIIISLLAVLVILAEPNSSNKTEETSSTTLSVEISPEDAYMSQAMSFTQLSETIKSSTPHEYSSVIRDNLYYSGDYDEYVDMFTELEELGKTYRIFCQPITIVNQDTPVKLYVFCETIEADSAITVEYILGARLTLDPEHAAESTPEDPMHFYKLTTYIKDDHSIGYVYSGSIYNRQEEIPISKSKKDSPNYATSDTVNFLYYSITCSDSIEFTIEQSYLQIETGSEIATCEFEGTISVDQLPEKTI